MVVGRAVVRDLLDGAAAQRLMSHVSMAFALGPAIAPILGGWIFSVFGWRAVFVFLALLGLVLAALSARYLPETHPPEARHPLHPGPLARRYKSVFTTPGFLLLTFTVSCNFNGFFLYVLSAPVFLMEHLGLPETGFGWFFIPTVGGMMLGSAASARLAGRLSPARTIARRCGIVLPVQTEKHRSTRVAHHRAESRAQRCFDARFHTERRMEVPVQVAVLERWRVPHLAQSDHLRSAVQSEVGTQPASVRAADEACRVGGSLLERRGSGPGRQNGIAEDAVLRTDGRALGPQVRADDRPRAVRHAWRTAFRRSPQVAQVRCQACVRLADALIQSLRGTGQPLLGWCVLHHQREQAQRDGRQQEREGSAHGGPAKLTGQ